MTRARLQVQAANTRRKHGMRFDRLRKWRTHRVDKRLDRPRRVAMIGSRGVPAKYGGVETVVEVLSKGLADRGHEVTVFCRRRDYEQRPSVIDGVRCVYLWAPSAPGIGALVHAFFATLWALPRGFDVLHYHALGPGLPAVIPRVLTSTRIVQTVHGRDDQRAKWGLIPRLILGLGFRLSASVPHETLVVSRELQRQYLQILNRTTTVVPNAVRPPVAGRPPGPLLESYGLEPRAYLLFVGRLVPEKAPHELIHGFLKSGVGFKLVLVGGTTDAEGYAGVIDEAARASCDVIMTGPLYDDDLAELLNNAAIFVTASHLEGLPTTVIEAGRAGIPCLASDIAPHLELLEPAGPGRRLFRVGDLDDFAEELVSMCAQIEVERDGAARLAREFDERFSVERAVEVHEIAYGFSRVPDPTG
jgi:glycosyltransferase involved in cell wall biosynthesis